jgi:2',3'-cyclic-nucleotide 2'-phosphodiesterase (5'-nucleotidase family)
MASKMQRITFVQQNDTHAHVAPHWEHFWREGKPEYRQTGGLARAAALVREIREETDGACLFLDCGDTLHGTGPAQWTEGAAIAPVLNAMGIDAMTPGNWEYGFGPEVLRRRAGELRFPLLAANVEHADSAEPLFPSTLLREVAGLSVGLVGLTSSIVDRMPRKFGAGLRFSDGRAGLRESIDRLRREGAAIVVALSHLGLPQEVQLLREIDDVDVLLSAHTHDRPPPRCR